MLKGDASGFGLKDREWFRGYGKCCFRFLTITNMTEDTAKTCRQAPGGTDGVSLPKDK